MPQELDFDDLTPTEIPIKIKGVVKYILKEASADVAIKYRNASMKGASIDTESKRVSPGESAGAEAIAVAASLYELFGDGNSKQRPVLLSTVLGWKNDVVKQLFDRLKEISPGLILSEGKEADVKKLPSEPQSDGAGNCGSPTNSANSCTN